jgi:hypothetical protein
MYAIFEHAIFDEPIEWFLAAARTLLVRLTQFIVEQERIRLAAIRPFRLDRRRIAILCRKEI